jgi:hypothetical protein
MRQHDRRNRSASIEFLENRRLLAADAAITARGTLVVHGTEGADFLTVRGEGNKVAVRSTRTSAIASASGRRT